MRLKLIVSNVQLLLLLLEHFRLLLSLLEQFAGPEAGQGRFYCNGNAFTGLFNKRYGLVGDLGKKAEFYDTFYVVVKNNRVDQ